MAECGGTEKLHSDDRKSKNRRCLGLHYPLLEACSRDQKGGAPLTTFPSPPNSNTNQRSKSQPLTHGPQEGTLEANRSTVSGRD